MFKPVLLLLLLTLSGLQAAPISPLRGLPKVSSTFRLSDGSQQNDILGNLPDGFQQGTEPSKRFFDNGLVQDHISEMNRKTAFVQNLLGEGLGEMETKHWRADEVPIDVPAQRNGGGWVRVEEPSSSFHLPDGFRQGTEPFMSISDGFRQGTEPFMSIQDGFRQGTEPFMLIQDGFRQGTEPFMSIPEGFRQGSEPFMPIPDGFRQGTEPFMSIPEGFRQGSEPFLPIPDGFRQGTEPFMSIPEGFRQGSEPFMPIPDGFRQGTEPFMSIPEGFRQGSEPFLPIPDGFRQGTEPFMSIPEGFRQGSEPFMPIPDGFRQGTEPFMSIPEGFRQGSEPFLPIPDGFRQGTEPFMPIPDGFRQGTEPFMSIPDGFEQGSGFGWEAEPLASIPGGFRQGTEPSLHIPDGFRQKSEQTKNKKGQDLSTSWLQTQTCKGEVINGKCYEFNPTPLAFKEAQDLCKAHNPHAELASVTSGDLHSRLVSMVTNGGDRSPQLTWLGARVKNQQASWLDGSEMNYSDWMPGHPNIHTDKPVCVEMFKIDESWWTAADCDLKRASICSYSIVV
ncbi:uncharacterized protein LOC133488740 [Phyllopteryx taeniolatus]|uniref:uncharacterized protein LOC133488740 n=1 Tax=Phyllopteryx taeniolatus TaxID=161469 RepID=UPI002AD26FB4|nr:uncharacterized protein LOC133488740 [Phyllopteryx taeniolatus]